MDNLMNASRTCRRVKVQVGKLTPAELIAELEERRCSVVGTEEIKKDR